MAIIGNIPYFQTNPYEWIITHLRISASCSCFAWWFSKFGEYDTDDAHWSIKLFFCDLCIYIYNMWLYIYIYRYTTYIYRCFSPPLEGFPQNTRYRRCCLTGSPVVQRGVHVGQGQAGGRLRWVAGPFAVQTEMAIAKWLCYALWTDMNGGRIWELDGIRTSYFFGGETYGYLIFTQTHLNMLLFFPWTCWASQHSLDSHQSLVAGSWFSTLVWLLQVCVQLLYDVLWTWAKHEYLLIFDRCVNSDTKCACDIFD